MRAASAKLKSGAKLVKIHQKPGSTGLHPGFKTIDLIGAPGTTRTSDLLIRSQALYPTELRAHLRNGHSAIRINYCQAMRG